MPTITVSPLERYLHGHRHTDWLVALSDLRAVMHEVDQRATRIWCYQWPVDVARALAAAPDRDAAVRAMWLQGRFDLAEQVDTSHAFLYGHRFWSLVKQTVTEVAVSGDEVPATGLHELVRRMADNAAARARMDVSLLVGITAVALMTLQHVGLEAFRKTRGQTTAPRGLLASAPDQIVGARERDDAQGLFGFLRGIKTRFTVRFDEGRDEACFPIFSGQHITTAALADRRDYTASDARCHEGPIPVQCRAASCGTCWVGVLGGNGKVSAASAAELSRLREFGYIDTGDERPVIRLACQVQAYGNVTLVIPPWNGIVGPYLSRELASPLAPR
ncbi:MAG: (2Fe-2S)-binding protein [Acidobacteria bacterium]|nr:(2Fe-2S)-binding protein [Acidobacteriota bacterium]